MELETTKFGKIGKSEEILKADVIKTAIDTLESSKPLDGQEYNTPTTLNGLVDVVRSAVDTLGGKFTSEVEYVVNGDSSNNAYITIPTLEFQSGGEITMNFNATSSSSNENSPVLYCDDSNYIILTYNDNSYSLQGNGIFSNCSYTSTDGDFSVNFTVSGTNDISFSNAKLLPISNFSGRINIKYFIVFDASRTETLHLTPMSTSDGVGFLRDTVSGTDYYSVTIALVPGPTFSISDALDALLTKASRL